MSEQEESQFAKDLRVIVAIIGTLLCALTAFLAVWSLASISVPMGMGLLAAFIVIGSALRASREGD